MLKGLALFETLGDSIRIADSYNHLATLEYNVGNLQKAIQYNENALAIFEKYNDTYYQAEALNDIGFMYLKLEDLNNAMTVSYTHLTLPTTSRV